MNEEERTNSGQFPAAGCAKGLATQDNKEAYQTVYPCEMPVVLRWSKRPSEVLQQRRMIRPCQTNTVRTGIRPGHSTLVRSVSGQRSGRGCMVEWRVTAKRYRLGALP